MTHPKSPAIAIQWNEAALLSIESCSTSPPLAARALAMLHTAMYDAWSVYEKCAISTTTAMYIKRHTSCTEDDIIKSICYAAYRVLTDLFWLALEPSKRNNFRDIMIQCKYDPDDCSLDLSKAQGIGNLVARLIIEYHRGDGSNQQGLLFHFAPWEDYTGYKPQNDPAPAPVTDINKWQPLTVNGKIQKSLLPHWSLVKPFALSSSRQFRPVRPFNNNDNPTEFKNQSYELIQISERLTDAQKVVAEYWSDGPGTATPPGHWCKITKYVIETKSYDLEHAIKLFFAVCNALHDAAVACWECKRRHDAVRPITAIHELYRGKKIKAWGGPGKGTVEMDGADWIPYQLSNFITPPFAEYVSGHSTFSMAAATVLCSFTGSDNFQANYIVKKGSSLIEPNITPAFDIKIDWPTFSSAAAQAGESRLFGGIHFRRANDMGQQLGSSVGKCVWEKAVFYFH